MMGAILILLNITFIILTVQQNYSYIAAHSSSSLTIIYGNKDITNDTELPVCEPQQVCNIISPPPINRLKKYCRCPGSMLCSEEITLLDNHTIEDKNNGNQVKICENVTLLPECKESEVNAEDRLWYYQISVFIYCKCPFNYTHELTNHSLDSSGHHFTYSCVPIQVCSETDVCCLIWLKQTSPHNWSYDGLYQQCVCPSPKKCSKDYYKASLFESEPNGKLAYVYCK